MSREKPVLTTVKWKKKIEKMQIQAFLKQAIYEMQKIL